MPENIIQIGAPWVALLLIVIALGIYKRSIDSHTDEGLHFGSGDDKLVQAQSALSRRSTLVERWGKILTTVVFLYGIVIAGLIAYHQWQISTTMGFK